MFANHLLHLVARISLRSQSSPNAAKRIVDAMGRLLPPLSVDEAIRVAYALEGAGTCLTRALTLAARLPGSSVVIGADGPGSAEHRFAAHAWVETGGRVVSATAPSRHEIARLYARRSDWIAPALAGASHQSIFGDESSSHRASTGSTKGKPCMTIRPTVRWRSACSSLALDRSMVRSTWAGVDRD
jgi:Transglutaminase-like superfamily